MTGQPQFILANDLNDALSCLYELGDAAVPVAGATWIMRAPIRRENADQTFVSLSRIATLRAITIDEREVVIGSLATHEQIASALRGHKDMAALAMAAAQSANPAIRRMATIGGNMCAASFAAADLVPALLALDAKVEVVSRSGTERLTMAAFLAGRSTRPHSSLVTRIHIPRSGRSSAHARLTLRKAGDYPVANLSVSIAVDGAGKIGSAAVAVGSVEAVAKRWTGFETAIIGAAPLPADMRAKATAHTSEFVGRDGPGAPGWYRLQVLPALVAKAFDAIQNR